MCTRNTRVQSPTTPLGTRFQGVTPQVGSRGSTPICKQIFIEEMGSDKVFPNKNLLLHHYSPTPFFPINCYRVHINRRSKSYIYMNEYEFLSTNPSSLKKATQHKVFCVYWFRIRHVIRIWFLGLSHLWIRVTSYNNG